MSNFNKREWIRHEYEAKKFQIRSRDPTKEIVYPNQAEAAVDIFKAFMIDGKVAVTLIALPQAGKTGTFLEVAYRMCTFNDDEKAIDPEQLLIITGMSDREWRWQTSNDMLTPFKNRVKHRGQFSSVPTLLKHLHDSLIIIDECHIAAEKEQSMSAMLRDAGLLNIEELRRRRIFLLEVSATPGATLYDTQNWGQDNHSIVILKESPKYVGFREFINEFRLHESYDLTQREQVVEMMNFIEGTFPDPRYHIIRLSGKKNSEETVQHIRQIANQRGWIVNHHNANNRMWDLDHIMTTPPMSHSFIIIKEFWRAGKRLCDKYVGIVHEPKTLVEDTNVTSQGLVGRLCGNDKQKGDAAPHAFCNMALIHEYLEWIDAHGDFEAVKRYRSKNLKANNGKVRSKESFVHHSNVEGVESIEDFEQNAEDPAKTVPVSFIVDKSDFEKIRKIKGSWDENTIFSIIKKFDINLFNELVRINNAGGKDQIVEPDNINTNTYKVYIIDFMDAVKIKKPHFHVGNIKDKFIDKFQIYLDRPNTRIIVSIYYGSKNNLRITNSVIMPNLNREQSKLPF